MKLDSRSVRLACVSLPSHGRGRRFEPCTAHQQIQRLAAPQAPFSFLVQQESAGNRASDVHRQPRLLSLHRVNLPWCGRVLAQPRPTHQDATGARLVPSISAAQTLARGSRRQLIALGLTSNMPRQAPTPTRRRFEHLAKAPHWGRQSTPIPTPPYRPRMHPRKAHIRLARDCHAPAPHGASPARFWTIEHWDQPRQSAQWCNPHQ